MPPSNQVVLRLKAPQSSSSSKGSSSGTTCSSGCTKNHCHHGSPVYSEQTTDMIQDAIILSELNSPTPDVHILFTHFDQKYFKNKLAACTTLRWSSRMTLCAGICYSQYQKMTITKTYGPKVGSNGGYDPKDILKKQEHVTQRICTISLSESLLKFRPPIDTISTLLHEMIHGFLFVDSNVVDREGHGDNFKWWMNHINAIERHTGIHISIYHTFHDEVDFYRQHHWKCQKCAMLVKRAMNRAPNKYDDWFPDHEKKCGGTFVKIKEPKKQDKKTSKKKESKGIEKSRKFMEKFIKKPALKCDDLFSTKAENSKVSTKQQLDDVIVIDDAETHSTKDIDIVDIENTSITTILIDDDFVPLPGTTLAIDDDDDNIIEL